jgi:5-methylcytosine-specific restriction endonuclease McrA
MKNKKWFAKDMVSEEEFVETCINSDSMSKAAAELGMHFNTFKRMAVKLKCYKPNKSGKGISKNRPKIPIEDIIFKGIYPQFQTFKLKNRLIKEGYKKNKCEECGIEEWNGKELNMELDHIDGYRTNHNLKNLRIICPNCHAQTSTYRAKNKK